MSHSVCARAEHVISFQSISKNRLRCFEQLETFIQYDICAVLLIRDENQSAAM